MRVKGGGTLLLQQHFVNTTTAPISGEAVVNFWYAEEPLARTLESFFFFHLDIAVPPHAEREVAGRCTFPFDTEIPGMNSHMHQHGVHFSAHKVEGGALGEMLMQTDSWQEPIARTWPLASMMSVRAGDTVEFRCRYQNDTDQPIYLGESATDEMCALIGFYVGNRGTLWGFPGLGDINDNPCVAVP
jgi:hypothetical protein